MSRYHEFKGYRWLKFPEDMAKWDVYHNADSYMKARDKPNVPRIVPAIRLNPEGQPACCKNEHGVPQPKVLACVYLEAQNAFVFAKYDPREAPEYGQYSVETYPPDKNGIPRLKASVINTYSDIRGMFKDFTSHLRNDIENPMRHAIPKRVGNVELHIPDEYKDTDYGSFA
jgi:hypothetical protein